MGFHPERTCMRRTIDQMVLLIDKNNITLPAIIRKSDHREETEEDNERFHALKASCSRTHAFLFDS